MAGRYDDEKSWDPETSQVPEEEGLDLLGRSLTAEQVKHESELARLAVLEREALAAAAASPENKFVIPRGRYDQSASDNFSPAESSTRPQPHRYAGEMAAPRHSEPARGAVGHGQRRAPSSVGGPGAAAPAARHSAAPAPTGPKRFIPSVTAAEEDRIIRENAGIAHRLESIQAKPVAKRAESAPAFDREVARDRVRRLKEKELERENWNLYKRLEGVRPTIKIGAVPTVPKRAASAAEKRPVVRLPRPEWQD